MASCGRRIKVALFWPTLGMGGVERRMLTTANGLAEAGFDVEVVVADASGSLRDEIPPGVRLVDLRHPIGGGRLMLALFPLRRYLSRARPDVVMSAMTQANLLALAARGLSGTRSRVIVSERVALNFHRSVRSAIYVGALRWAMKALYRRADAIVCVSQGIADELRALLGERVAASIRVIANPVVSESLLRKAQSGVDHPWFVEGAPPVIVSVGRLNRQKGFDTLIGAFATLRARMPARLLIIGEGPERASLQQLIGSLKLEDDVQLMGEDPNPYRFMSRAALFVLSSRYEGFPGVLVEAMACGAPVVSTDCPTGPREILADGVFGRLVPVDDAAGLAAAIESTLERPPKRRQLVERGLEFSEERAIAAYVELMESVLS